MYQYLFTKLIFDSQGHSMRGILEYKQPSYICSEYSRNRTCDRHLIKEEILNDFVLKYCNLKNKAYVKNKEFMKTIINKIIIYPNESFEIYYLDDTYACFNNNCVKYV